MFIRAVCRAVNLFKESLFPDPMLQPRRRPGRRFPSAAAEVWCFPTTVEPLENRLLLSAVNWVGSGDGQHWSDAANWSTGAVPDAADDVTLNAPAGTAIQGPTLLTSIKSLSIQSGNLTLSGSGLTVTEAVTVSSGQSLTLSSGTLTATTVSVNDSTLTLTGGTIKNATIDRVGNSLLSIEGGELDGVTVNGDFRVTSNLFVNVINGLTLNGTVTLGDAAVPAEWGSLDFTGTQTLGGTGTVVFGNSNLGNTLRQNTSNATLTIGAGITVRGQTGYIGYNPNRSGPPNVNVINLGTIEWIAGSDIRFGAALTNSGAMHVGSTGVLNVVGTVVGGVITTQAGATFIGGTLDGVTVNGDFRVTGNSFMNVINGLTLNGTVTLGDAAVPAESGFLDFTGSQTLGGTGTVVFGNSNLRNTLRQNNSNATLTIGAGITIRGQTGYIGYNPNQSGPPNVNVINHGTIQADVAGGTIVILASIMSSPGALVANAGSTLNLVSSIANAANTLSVSGSGTLLISGTVSGGTLAVATGTHLEFPDTTLDGVTVNGDFRVTSNLFVNVINGLTLNGTVTLGDAAVPAEWGSLDFTGTQTLGGTGTVVFGNSNLGNTLRQNNTNATLTIGTGITVRGKTGYLGYNPNRSGTPAVNVINQGTVAADVSAGMITIFGVAGGQNTGSVRAANGGTAIISGDNWKSSGVLEAAAGSFLSLTASFANTGNTMSISGPGTSTSTGSIIGGILSVAAGASLTVTGGTWDGVTVNGDFRVTSNQFVNVINGLTLNGTVTLGDAAVPTEWGSLDFTGTQTLGGTGTVVFGNSNLGNTLRQNNSSATLTIGAGITVRGQAGYIGYNPYRSGTPLVNILNQGTINLAAGTNINISGTFTNQGSLKNANGTFLTIDEFSETDGLYYFSTSAGATIAINGDLVGNTQASSAFINAGEVQIIGGTVGIPRYFETMSLDRGPQGSSVTSNFYYNVVRLGASSNVRLIDQHRNSSGTQSEVLYVGTLIVSAGSTLDLNGLKVYARLVKIDGTVVGGTIAQIPDSGPLVIGSPTPGSISAAGELDEWTFYSRSGRTIAIRVNPSGFGTNAPVAPQLDRAQITLIAPSGSVVGTANNSASGGAFTINDVLLTEEGTYRIQIRAAAGFSSNTGNYTISTHDVTADVANVSIGQTVVGSIEDEFSVDRWNFTATQGQQIKFNLKAKTGDVAFTLTGPNGFNPFTDAPGSSDLITLPTMGAYQLTARGQNGASGLYSFQLLETAITDLPLGQTVTQTNGGTGAVQLFRIHVPTGGKPLVIRMDDSTDENKNILYAKFGSPPTRSDFDYTTIRRPIGNVDTADIKGKADPSLLIPSATPGDWYVLVYGNFSTPSSFTMQAVTSTVVLTHVTPDQFGANSSVDLTLTGAGFQAGATVQLIGAANNVVATATNVQINSFTQLSATMSLAGITSGKYGVRVTLPGGSSDTFLQSFTVLPGGEANLETRLIMPGSLGRHSSATMFVEYANTGTVAMAAPLLRLQSADPDNSDHPILTLDQSRVIEGFWGNGIPDGFSESIQILASGATPGLLNPGERITVPVYYVGLKQQWNFSDNQVEMEIRIFDSHNTDAIPWSTLQNELRPSTIPTDAWNAIFGNLTVNVGATWGNFVDMLSDNAKYLNSLGRHVVDVSELWSFEVQQAIGFSPIRTLASSVDAAITAAGSDLSFGRLWSVSLDQRFSTSLFGRGWSAPWQTRLTVEADGSVNIFGAGGSRRRFQPDSRFDTVPFSQLGNRSTFFSAAGDTGTLIRVSNGIYEVREQNGSITRFNATGQIDYTQDANGNRVTAGYGGSSRLTSLTHSSGASIAITYNGAGLIQSLTDSANRVTTFTYDSSNQYLLSATGPDGVITSYTYDTTTNSPRQHALTSITAGGVTQIVQYDNRGRLSATAIKLSPTTETARINFTYDTAGRVSVSDATGGTTNLFYDERGLMTKVTDPFGNVTTAEYGDDLRISRIVDPLGQSQAFTWCGCGSLTSSTDQLGHKTTFTNEYVGPNNTIRRMTSFTDANGNTTRYTYDSKGNLTSTIYPNGSIERTTTYDPLGDPLTFINRRGQVMSYTYNATGQVTRQTFDDGSFIDLAYDARGNLSMVTEPGNKMTTYTYDSGDRLTRVLYPQGRFLEFTYDASGRRRTMTDQLGYVVRYSYDAAGRLFQLHDTDNALIVEYLYNSSGRLSRKNNGNNTFTVYTYDVAGQILSIVNQAPDGSVNSNFVYTYDALGRRTTMTTIDGTWIYGYDPTGQLTSAVFTPVAGSPISAHDLQYVYDPLGNRIRTIENGVTTEYTTNNLNQYTQVGGDTLIYDADGNLVSRSGPSGNATYTYDQQSRLTRIVTPDGTWHYEYDVFGNRTASTLNGGRTEYLLDPTGLVTVVGEYSQTGVILARLTFGHSLVSRIEMPGNSLKFFDNDAIGSTVGTTDSLGTTISRHAYTPFGTLMQTTGFAAGSTLFVGGAGTTAESRGVYFMRSRYYDSTIGRFLTIDPIRLLGGDVNLSRYVGNQPTLFTDPTGLAAFWNPGPVDDKGSGCGSSRVEQWLIPDEAFWANYGRACQEHDDCYKRCGGKSECDSNLAGDILLDNGWFYADNAFKYWVGVWIGGGTAYDKSCSPDPEDPDPPKPPGGDEGDDGDSDTAQAQDPNELIGPSGYGPNNFVSGSATLPYRIDFENYGPGSTEHDGTPTLASRWATAPAQQVEITNSLPAQIDLDTFTLTGFGFGDFNIVLLTGAQHHEQVLSMTFGGKTFEVWFSATLDRVTRTLRVLLQSIDPHTQLPPDVLTGFLPPEDGTGRGKGFVTYAARPIPDLPTGTEIRNIALISFDHQPTISTDQIDPLNPALGIDTSRQARVTIDAGTPTAVMQALPTTTTTSNFAINWSGTDDIGGSGIGSYDIYVSDNGGDYVPFLTNTTLTTATFSGANGHSYRFHAIAKDNVGQIEAGVQSAEAETTLDYPELLGWDTSVSYTENAAPAMLDTNVTMNNIHSPNLGTGTLTVSITANGELTDRLEIRQVTRLIGVNGSNVTYRGTTIGSFTGGVGTEDLVFTLNANATPVAVQALLRNVTYRNISENPSTAPRTVRVTLNDGNGGTSNLPTKTINVSAVNDPPVIGAFDTTVTYAENGTAVLLDTNATVTDFDTARFDMAVLTFSLTANAEASDRLEFRTVPRLIGVSGANVTYRGTTIGSFTGGIGTADLVITFNANATVSAVQALLRNVTYRSVSSNPSTAPRTIKVALTDGNGGTSNLPTKTINFAPGAAPLAIALPAPSVAEDQPSGTTVRRLSATDSEYSLAFIDTPIAGAGNFGNDQNREYLLSFVDAEGSGRHKKRRRSL